MKKYIDVDLLKENLDSFIDMSSTYTDYNCGYDDCLTAVQDTISDMPAADVVEVVHGKWIDVPLNSDPNYFAYKYNLRTKCSVCDFAMPREYPRYNICPNCGAKMDKE